VTQGFSTAYEALKQAREKHSQSLAAKTAEERDVSLRSAFYQIYTAASLANACYIATSSFHSGFEGGLANWANGELEDYLKIAYKSHYINGEYPKQTADREFELWLKRCKDYIDLLREKASNGR